MSAASTSSTESSGLRFIGDPVFQALFAAGPATWVLLWVIGLPVANAPLISRLPWETALFGILVFPILEEIVFRGLLQGALLERQWLRQALAGPISRANAATSVLFVSLHLISQPPLWALLVLPPSLAFGLLRDRHGRVLPSILLHAFYNAGFLLLFADHTMMN